MFLLFSMPSRNALRNSGVPGFPAFSASGTAFANSKYASYACPPNVARDPGPNCASYLVTYSSAVFLIGFEYVTKYEAQFGPGSRATFGGHAYDAYLLFANAVPDALKAGKPGTPEFRKALRDGIEKSKNMVGVHGIFNLTDKDHVGLDERARLLVLVQCATCT